MSKQLLTKEELDQLKSIRENVMLIVSALGELEYQKILIQQEHEKLQKQVEAIREKEQVALKEFGQKYGDGIINLETGEIDPKS